MKSTDIYPTGNMILVRHTKNERASSIIVTPQDDKFNGYKGVVLAFGPDVNLLNTDHPIDSLMYSGEHINFRVKVGDTIIFQQHAGVDLPKTEDGLFLTLLTPRQVLAVEKGAV